MAKLINISVGEFKTRFSCTTLQIVRNPNTSKLFVSTDNGKNFRCQQNIDLTKVLTFLKEEDASEDDWCLANGSGDNIVGTL